MYGWSNASTWRVITEIENTEPLYLYWQREATRVVAENHPDPVKVFARRLRAGCGGMGIGTKANWREIAESLLGDVKRA